ncbi:hypothetical protein GOP47_0026265 [Adiantum capillus-veneris]|nr:hypothetical protein GOP47_0026265 [Adiantum capillus-veneris]
MSWMVSMTTLTFISFAVMAILPTCTSLFLCPSSCSFISPVPYPFGAAEGCGLPGFQLSNCTTSPQWNLHLGDTVHTYYIISIFPTPNSSNHSSVLSYGYGGAVLLSLPTPDTPLCHDTDPLSPLISAFSSSNMYAFEGASLSFYQQRYLLFNCSASSLQAPSSGSFTRSSLHCTNYLSRCNLSKTDRCLEYSPDKELYLPTLMSAYGCSSFRRFVIADDDEPVEKWIVGTQFAWGPVDNAEACSACQNTGGTCGYNTEDNGFLCYCGDNAYSTNCKDQTPSGTWQGAGQGSLWEQLLQSLLSWH